MADNLILPKWLSRGIEEYFPIKSMDQTFVERIDDAKKNNIKLMFDQNIFPHLKSWSSLELTAGTTLNLWENVGEESHIGDELDHLPVLEFGVTYSIRENLDIELGFDYDLEAEDRSDIKMVATFSF